MKNIPINKIEIKDDKKFKNYYTNSNKFLEINEKKINNQIKINNNKTKYKLSIINHKKNLIPSMKNYLFVINTVIILLS